MPNPYPFDTVWASEAIKDSDDRINRQADQLIQDGYLEEAQALLDEWYN